MRSISYSVTVNYKLRRLSNSFTDKLVILYINGKEKSYCLGYFISEERALLT